MLFLPALFLKGMTQIFGGIEVLEADYVICKKENKLQCSGSCFHAVNSFVKIIDATLTWMTYMASHY